jgi:hypothetical protein
MRMTLKSLLHCGATLRLALDWRRDGYISEEVFNQFELLWFYSSPKLADYPHMLRVRDAWAVLDFNQG